MGVPRLGDFFLVLRPTFHFLADSILLLFLDISVPVLLHIPNVLQLLSLVFGELGAVGLVFLDFLIVLHGEFLNLALDGADFVVISDDHLAL